MEVPYYVGTLTIVGIVGLLLFDFLSHVQKIHIPTLRGSAIMSSFKVPCADQQKVLLFGIVFTATLFSLMGLRQLFFLIDGEPVQVVEITTGLSLSVVLGVLVVIVLASMFSPKGKAKAELRTLPEKHKRLIRNKTQFLEPIRRAHLEHDRALEPEPGR